MQPRRAIFAAFAVTVLAAAGKPETEVTAACPRCGRVHGKLGD